MARMTVAMMFCIAMMAVSAFADTCPYADDTTGRNCCTDEQCRKAVNSQYVYCNMAVMQCNACGNDGAPNCPGGSTTTPSGTPTTTTTPSGCPVTPGNGFCCADSDCTKNGQTNVYCNKQFYQCNSCGTVGAPLCPTAAPTTKPTDTPTTSATPTATPTTSATPTMAPTTTACPVTPGKDGFCCADSDCTKNGQTNVYCNKQFYQCNACGIGSAPACPTGPTTAPTTGPTTAPTATPSGSCPVTPGNGNCCSDADCKVGGQTLVYCNMAVYQCNACGNGNAPPCPK